MAKFPGKPRDLKWGRFDYPVTPSQKRALDAIWYMMSGLPKAYSDPDGLPESGFYSQNPHDGSVIIGLHHQSLTVYRSGTLTANIGETDTPTSPTSEAGLRRARDLIRD